MLFKDRFIDLVDLWNFIHYTDDLNDIPIITRQININEKGLIADPGDRPCLTDHLTKGQGRRAIILGCVYITFEVICNKSDRCSGQQQTCVCDICLVVGTLDVAANNRC